MSCIVPGDAIHFLLKREDELEQADLYHYDMNFLRKLYRLLSIFHQKK